MTTECYKLSRKKVKQLTNYYVILLIVGIIMTVAALLHDSFEAYITISVSLVSIIGGIGTAMLGNTIFYLRKLYKSCINADISEPATEDDLTREIGISAYYFLRPLFAIAFSLLIHITLKSSVHIITVKESTLSEGFIYLTMFFSFFAGFATGDIITYVERKSNDIITNVFKRD